MNSSLKENNAWVTGHSGFIGNSLIEDLNDEFSFFKYINQIYNKLIW